mmetsp:Transcript_21086/g.58817  ORF Transcript_21086/g.58817 Transcript_21086/m.58817 type:complete len:306 (-) Transcript_21086:347-1264(-)
MARVPEVRALVAHRARHVEVRLGRDVSQIHPGAEHRGDLREARGGAVADGHLLGVLLRGLVAHGHDGIDEVHGAVGALARAVPEVGLAHIGIQPRALRHGHRALFQILGALVVLDRLRLRLQLAHVARVSPPQRRLHDNLHPHHLVAFRRAAIAWHLPKSSRVALPDGGVDPLADVADDGRVHRQIEPLGNAFVEGIVLGPEMWPRRQIQPGTRPNVPDLSRERLSQGHTPPTHASAAEGILGGVLSEPDEFHDVRRRGSQAQLHSSIGRTHGRLKLPLRILRIRLPRGSRLASLTRIPLPEHAK